MAYWRLSRLEVGRVVLVLRRLHVRRLLDVHLAPRGTRAGSRHEVDVSRQGIQVALRLVAGRARARFRSLRGILVAPEQMRAATELERRASGRSGLRGAALVRGRPGEAGRPRTEPSVSYRRSFTLCQDGDEGTAFHAFGSWTHKPEIEVAAELGRGLIMFERLGHKLSRLNLC